MFRLFKACLLVLFLISTTTVVNSDTSWIKKKSDKTTVESKKIEKKKKKNTTSTWITKKKVKENKKNLKEKIKKSKSWITKKSKNKIKEIKKNLKKHKNIEDLPKANFYFTARIEPKENEEPKYLYGYIKSDKKSKTFKFKNQLYYTINDGIAYSENQKYSCEVNLNQDTTINLFVRDIVLDCKKFNVTGTFAKKDDIGEFEGEATGGNTVLFEITKSKSEAMASLKKIKRKPRGTTILADDDDYDDDNLLDLKVNGKYYALLIGNSNYINWAKLTSPANDVNQIGKILKNKYNFTEVLIVKNADRDKIFDSFEKLSELTSDNDYVLVYYAGHGDIKHNKSYWIPVNAKKNSRSQWINISDIENYLLDIPAHHLAVMVDSCYFSITKGSNIITEKRKSMFYQKLLDKRARLVLASGQNEPVDDTGKGNNSIFGISFINSLKNNANAISLREIGNNIAYAHAGMRQQPYLHLMLNWGHTNGDFIFIAKK